MYLDIDEDSKIKQNAQVGSETVVQSKLKEDDLYGQKMASRSENNQNVANPLSETIEQHEASNPAHCGFDEPTFENNHLLGLKPRGMVVESALDIRKQHEEVLQEPVIPEPPQPLETSQIDCVAVDQEKSSGWVNNIKSSINVKKEQITKKRDMKKDKVAKKSSQDVAE